MLTALLTLEGVVKRGYGVASGIADDPRFPHGTLRMQFPHFKARGLDLNGCFPGTINLDIAPLRFALREPDITFEMLHWSPQVPAETFSFCACEITYTRGSTTAWIYYPHPETKPEHFHGDSTIELLAPLIDGLVNGSALRLTVEKAKLRIYA